MELLQPSALTALFFGILSAVSLPLGAWVGIKSSPSQRVTAGVLAFGAGALLAALTLELVHEALTHGGFWPLAIGCVLGGVTFAFLNQAVNNRGGFLRKTATLIKHVTELKRHRVSRVIDHLSRVKILNVLPPEEIHAIVPHVKERIFESGSRIVTEGEAGFELYIVDEGTLKVTKGGEFIAGLKAGDVFGEMALLADEVRHATVTATSPVVLFEIHKQDFKHLLSVSPRLAEEFHRLYELRKLSLEEIRPSIAPSAWAERMKKTARQTVFKPTELELRAVAHEHVSKISPVSIWLGLLLDGIPESVVIGASMVGGATVSMALIAGIFLSNFPESMASAIGMRKMGMSTKKIAWLWWPMCLLLAIAAYIGNLTFQGASTGAVALVEGLAAGAMLAMIAETMMPEAYEQGGPITGMATVLGFLSAVFVKTLEH